MNITAAGQARRGKIIYRGGRCNVPAVVKVYLPQRACYTARHGKSVNRGGQSRPPRLSHDLTTAGGFARRGK